MEEHVYILQTEHKKREEPGRQTRNSSYKKVKKIDLEEWTTPINGDAGVF
jgi:hypothetical protein